MKNLSEIYLVKKSASSFEWNEFIRSVSSYHKLFHSLKILIFYDKGQIRYFIQTNCFLPVTVGQVDAFFLKSVKSIKSFKARRYFFCFFPVRANMFDLIHYYEARYRYRFLFSEITFFKLSKGKTFSRIYLFFQSSSGIKRCFVCCFQPELFLSFDFHKTKRFYCRGLPKYFELFKVLPSLSRNSFSSLFRVDGFPYLKDTYYMGEKDFQFDKHSIILGASGSGKSKFVSLFLSHLFHNSDFRKKYRVVVIDPHASLIEEIGSFSQVIDFLSDEAGTNLFVNSGDEVILSSELLLELFQSLLSDVYNSKLERVLRHSIYVLLVSGAFSFQNLRRILLDLEFRNRIIQQSIKKLPISVVEFFEKDFSEFKTKYYMEAISPIISFLDEMEMIPIFSNEFSSNIEMFVHNHFCTLFSLDRTKLGDKVVKMISGLVMEQIFLLAQKRVVDRSILLVVDEVSLVENPILCRYLSEARKYHLSLILIGQYFNQLSSALKNSIFSNVINYFIFRVSQSDASILLDHLNMKLFPDDSVSAKVKFLTELNDRECVLRVMSREKLLPAFWGITMNYKSMSQVKRSSSFRGVGPFFKQDFCQDGDSFLGSTSADLKKILYSNSSSR